MHLFLQMLSIYGHKDKKMDKIQAKKFFSFVAKYDRLFINREIVKKKRKMNRTQSSYCYLRNRVIYFYTCSMNSVHISYLKKRDSLIVSINLNGLQIETNHPDTHFKNVERYKIYCHLKPMRKAHLIYSDIEIQLHSFLTFG